MVWGLGFLKKRKEKKKRGKTLRAPPPLNASIACKSHTVRDSRAAGGEGGGAPRSFHKGNRGGLPGNMFVPGDKLFLTFDNDK